MGKRRFRVDIGKGKGKYRKQERNMLKPKTNPREKGEFRVEIGNWKKESLERI